nr:unnamed protein product [Callosobruchus analis]
MNFFKYSENDLLRAIRSIERGETSLNFDSNLYGILKDILRNK